MLTLGLAAATVTGVAAFGPAPQPVQGDLAANAAEQRQLQAPDGYELTDHWYESHDGVRLHAGVYLPADRVEDEQHPIILSVTPYTSPNGGSLGLGYFNSEIPVRFPELFEHPAFAEGRYAYIAADVRGFGGSGGCFQYYGNDEYLDMNTHVEWAGTQDWSTGKVGLWGKSYDAAQQVLALGEPSEHLSAAVIQAPGLSAYTALWQNGVHYATGRYATTSVYVADDLFPTQSAGSATSADYALSQVDGAETRPKCAADWQGMNLIGDRDNAYWDDLEPYRNAEGSDVPVLWHNGFFDANTKPVGLDIVQSLTGDLEVIWGQWDHKRGQETQYIGRDGFLDQSFRFFEEHLLGQTPAVDDPKAIIQSGGPLGIWRAEAQWPPADVEPWTMTLNDGTYIDQPEAVDGRPASGGGIWSVTAPLTHDAHIAGEPVLRGKVIPFNTEQHLVARLYDIAPDGRSYLISRVAYATPSTPVPGVDIELQMNPNDWIVRPGHRIGLYINAAEDAWYTPGVTGLEVFFRDATLELPLISTARTELLEGGLSNFSQPFPITVSETLMADNEVEGTPPAQID
jgi:predicted acyl esterase